MEKYNVEFYVNQKGQSEIVDYLDTLKESKLRKAMFAIERLSNEGTRVGYPLVAWLVKGTDKMWELRIDQERFPFFLQGNTIVLVSHFTKKDKKAPTTEIRKAIRLKQDWIKRNS